MSYLINWLQQHLGLLLTLFCSLLVSIYITSSIVRLQRRRKTIIPTKGTTPIASRSGQTGLLLKEKAMKVTRTTLTLLLGVVIGYAISKWQNSLIYDREHAAWVENDTRWQKYFNVYEQYHKENK